MTDENLPADIDPESRSRLKLPLREDLPEEFREIHDHFTDPNGSSYVGLRGPGGLRLHSPKLAEAMQVVNHYIRYEAGIDPRLRELVVISTARGMDSQFEWTAHEPEAQKQGIPQSTIDAVKYRKSLDGVPPDDAVVIQFVRELVEDRQVSSATYAKVIAMFGERLLVDIVGLIGNYAATAMLLCAFDMHLHPGKKPLLP
jgi:4-carboxymuconolactone decarboxylase